MCSLASLSSPILSCLGGNDWNQILSLLKNGWGRPDENIQGKNPETRMFIGLHGDGEAGRARGRERGRTKNPSLLPVFGSHAPPADLTPRAVRDALNRIFLAGYNCP